jgi:CRP-like cAMP-binding protein
MVDRAITPFLRAAEETQSEGELLVIPRWRRPAWATLFSYTERLAVPSGHVVISKGAAERALYLVTAGLLEVTSVLGAHSLGVITTVAPGSVVGELSFLDGRPRSAKVWAIADSELHRLHFNQYERYAAAHPREACDLLFALGRLVALRLRHTTSRMSQYA